MQTIRQLYVLLASNRLTRICVWTAAWLTLGVGIGPAAAQVDTGSSSEVTLVAQLVALILSGRLLGEAMRRIGQPAVMGELLAGVLLGPSVLGAIWPDLQHWLFPAAKEQKAMLNAISNLGILLLLLLTGMETDLKLVRRFWRAALSVSLSGVAIPFACGVAFAAVLPDSLLPGADKRLLTALFLGTALSISSIKIVAAVVGDMNFTRRNLGQIIVSSSIMEDTIGWIIISITLGLAAEAHIDVAGIARSVFGTAVFLFLSLTIGRRLVFQVIRFANDNFESEFSVITAILAIMGIMALITYLIGVSTVLGAFVSGLLIGQSPILTRHIDEQLRGLIVAFFMPVFFGVAGLGTNLAVLANPDLLWLTLGLIAVASIAKFAGAFLGGEIGGLTRREGLVLGFAMNARGSTEVIVASIGLSMGALTQNLFTMIVVMAIATTMAMPPMLRWGLSRVPISRSERRRLKREEIEERGFVPNIERLLLAVDDSANGRFAARLGGLIAGARGMPITVVPVGEVAGSSTTKKGKRSRRSDDEHPATQAASDAVDEGRSKETKAPQPLDVTVRRSDRSDSEAVADEADKGYDLLLIGIDSTRTKSGRFSPDIEHIAAKFDGPLAIVEAKGRHREHPVQSKLDILAPVNGTEAARRGAEVAIAIARAVRAPLRAIYVSEAAAKDRAKQRNTMRARWHEQAVLKDVVELADIQDQAIIIAVRSNKPAADAIVAEIGRNADSLIVMGVGRRPAVEQQFFGEVAAAVLDEAPASVLLIAC